MVGRRTVLQLAERALVFAISIFVFANLLFIWEFVINDPEKLSLPKTIEPYYVELLRDDLRLDGSLSEQYSNFMVKLFSGDFFLSTGVLRFEPISDFVYEFAFTTICALVAVFILSLAIAGMYSYFAHVWSSRIRGKTMLAVALILAVTFAISLWLSLMYVLGHVRIIRFWDYRFTLSVLWASIPVGSSFVLVMDGLLKRAETVELSRPKRLVMAIFRVPSSSATLSLFAVYAMICVLIADIYMSTDGLGTLAWDALLTLDLAVLTVTVFILATILLLIFLLIDVLRIFACMGEVGLEASEEEPPSPPRSSKLLGALGWPVVPAMWESYRRDRVALLALMVFVALVVMGSLAPILSTVKNPYDYENYEPTLMGDYGEWLQLNPMPPSLTPSEGLGFIHPLGTDHAGRDVYSMLLYEALECVGIAVLLVAIAVSVGTLAAVVRFYTERSRPSIRATVGYSSTVAAEVLLLLPLLAVLYPFSWIYGHEHEVLLTVSLVVWMWAAFGKEEALNILQYGTGGGRRILSSPFTAKGAAAIVFRAKFCFLFGFFLIAYFIHTFWTIGWLEIGWVEILENAYSFGAFFRWHYWWMVIPPMVLVALLAGSVYVMLDRLERILLSWSHSSEAVSPPPGSPPSEP